MKLKLQFNMELNVELNLKSNLTSLLNEKLNLKLALTFVWSAQSQLVSSLSLPDQGYTDYNNNALVLLQVTEEEQWNHYNEFIFVRKSTEPECRCKPAGQGRRQEFF